jgi:hypothetical protein
VTEFDPEKFEDKDVHHLDELQTAYRTPTRTCTAGTTRRC